MSYDQYFFKNSVHVKKKKKKKKNHFQIVSLSAILKSYSIRVPLAIFFIFRTSVIEKLKNASFSY